MAIWDSLLRRLINPIVNESINKEFKELKEEKIEKGLVSQITQWGAYPIIEGTAPVYKIFPRGVQWKTLRDFSFLYPVLRACINYRKRQISQLAWDITSKEVISDKDTKEKYKKDIEEIKNFFRYPAGDKTMSFRTFLNKILEDLVVLDAVAIYRRENRKGGLYGYLPIDASTIEIMLYQDGTTPIPPDTAYQQKISGMVKEKLTTDELIYKEMNPRSDSPYGLSPVEALIIVVTTALKLSAYNLAYLTEGNVPEGFVELPKDIASNADQLNIWQEKWDTMFSGDPRFQRKIKFLPEGMKWHPTKKAEDLQFERFEKWLLLQTCSVMEVPPQAIGFQFERGKGATEAEWEIGKERGMFPLANFLKELFDQIIQEDLGQPHLEFVWTNINPTNKKEEADVFNVLVRTGAVSVDEWRLGEGLDSIGCPHYIMTPIGPIFVKDLVSQSEAGQKPYLPYKPQIPQNVPQKIKQITRGEIAEELKRWKKVVANDFKQGKSFREFKTDLIDIRTQGLIKNGLKTIKTKEDLDQLFSPFIAQENQIISAMLDLYDEVNDITGYKESDFGPENEFTATQKSPTSN